MLVIYKSSADLIYEIQQDYMKKVIRQSRFLFMSLIVIIQYLQKMCTNSKVILFILLLARCKKRMFLQIKITI